LRNVAAIFGAVAKKFVCEEQASWQAVCLGWGAQKRSYSMRTLIASSGIVAALLVASTAVAQTPNQNAQFCLKSSPTAQPNCMYQTMAQCEQAKGSNASAQCIPNSNTTGQGGAGGATPKSPPSQSPSPNPNR
jgi:uncharacterized low-complexity protein